MAPPVKKHTNNKSQQALKNIQKPSFKQKSQSDEAVQSKPPPLTLDDDVPDFPRGGAMSLTREERKGIQEEVDVEFDSEARELKKRNNKLQNRRFRTDNDELGSLFGEGITGKLPKFANKVTLKNVSPGMKLWGVITEVNEKDIVVGLPGGLRGLVRSCEALDTFTENKRKGELEGNILSSIYHTGQLVSCIVLQLDDDKKDKGKRKLWLSLRLSLLYKGLTLDAIQDGMVLSAYVKSVEDHGYMLHFGLPSFSGFMAEEIQPGRKANMHSGKLVQGVVKSIDRNRKVVYLSSDDDLTSKCLTRDIKGISIDLLLPGMMVNAHVKATLENGIMLSFLTYFSGTVDIFHLEKPFPSSNWKEEYSQYKKVNARILFIDPSTRAVGLTLNPNLVHNKAPPAVVKAGDIFDDSKVIRIDRGLGLLLEIPSLPVPTPAYVSVSDASDKDIRKLEKSFKEGSRVRVRVLGFRHLEGLATGVLKTSAFEGSVFTHSDVKPGMVVKAKVTVVDSFGAIVQLASGVKALCPLRHMSELDIAKPRKKFQVGAELIFRVLGCKSKRITVTHKKTLVKSKLDILSSYADATEGLITHGWITKIENHGCFVRFYNGVQGFAPRSELGLDRGSEISSIYHVEEVVKCRVTSTLPSSRRINLSFIMSPTRMSEDVVKPGRLISGVVERITPNTIIVSIDCNGYTKGTLSTEHLADNQGLAALMKSSLKPGYEFDRLLVLDVESSSLVLTAKNSLINSSDQLPLDVSQLRPHSVVHGYVCNLIETGCFVRFLGRLTGFAPKSKSTDDWRVDLSGVYYIGQSVRCNIHEVNKETGRTTLSLKQSMCSSTDASFLQEYFILEEKVANMQLSNSNGSELKWVEEFSIGNLIEGEVQETKNIGAVIRFKNYDDVFGFITPYQLGGHSVVTGSIVKAMVLDVAKMERLVDLSLKPDIVNRFKEDTTSIQSQKKKRKREAHKDMEVQQTVNAVVEIVKENYLVMSIPEYNFALGYASLKDYNTQLLPPKQFLPGQCVNATVVALPSPSTAGRLLLLLNSVSALKETSSSKRAKKRLSYDVGSLVQAEITDIKPLELKLKFGHSLHGRVHITEANDEIVEDPFKNFKIGQTLTAKIVSKPKLETSKKFHNLELSIKPSLLAADTGSGITTEDFSYVIGQRITGFVYKVDTEWVWFAISRDVSAQLYVLDSACEPNKLQEFQKRFSLGETLTGYILSINKEKKLLRVVLHPLADVPNRENGVISNSISREIITSHLSEGRTIGGRIIKILPGIGGLLVQIDPHLYGKVHYTELADDWVSDPLSGYSELQFVKCKVLEISRSVMGTTHVELSVRPGSHALESQKPAELGHSVYKRVEKMEDIRPNEVIQGYVKNVTPRGCFIMLSRKFDAKILISNLSDEFVENPERQFPVGKLVKGKVLSVEPLSMRIEVTLRTTSTTEVSNYGMADFKSIHVGNIISGKVKRIESYGLFITIDQTNMVGLCHLSQLPEEHIEDLEAKYKAGDKVTAKILKVDEDRRRISLGMKDSDPKDNTDIQPPSNRMSGDVSEDDLLLEGEHLMSDDASDVPPVLCQVESRASVLPKVESRASVLSKVESRASVLPLEVTLDDAENSPVSHADGQRLEEVDNIDIVNQKNKKLAKKKAKEEREREISAAEERLIQEDIPRTADEFEKLIRNSPNSSFLWIKYMEFMISLSDVDKARSIAERALRTINIREESEKLNIWVAFFNLENEYGNPPEDAVVKIFQRALQYCDPKKVHLALLGVYERTERPEQQKMANELIDKMVKKFKHSCKVWLRRIQILLKQKQDGVQPLVNRALLSLPRHKHIKFISQAAILEFKGGVPDRGRSMFEGMLKEYPKRTDLWSIYLDQEIRLGDMDVIRSLFERAISLSLPPKKMKFLFKKYLEYEKSLGDEDRIEYVKRKAMEYVESTIT